MEEFEKRIQIADNRILIYSVTKGYAKPTFTIREGIAENGVLKTYSLSQWDDYGLNGWIENDEDISKISFEFDNLHPLYIPLFHLLNYDEELIIDDDDTRDDNQKYMSIYKNDNKIIIDFVDNLEQNNHINCTEKFHVFIKNILRDGRSKIDQQEKDTKKRLFIFFNEVNKVIMNEYHQISIEEYLIKESTDERYNELKRVYRRNYE